MSLKNLAGALASFALLAPQVASAETLTFGTASTPEHPIVKRIFNPWVDEVNAAADGAVEIIPRHGPALASLQNSPDRVLDDVIQLGWTVTVFHPGRFPNSLVATLPFVGGSTEANAMAFCRLYEEGALGSDYDEFVPLLFVPFPQSSVHLNGKPITRLEDMEGQRIMVGSPLSAQIVTAYGGTPLSIILPDQYQALQRGTADGNIMSFTAFPAFRLNEVTSDHLTAPLGGAIGIVFMHRERYDALSDEARAVIDAHSGCEASVAIAPAQGEWEMGARGYTKANGEHTITPLSDEAVAEARDKLFDEVAGGFAERAPGGADLVQAWVEGVAQAEAELAD